MTSSSPLIFSSRPTNRKYGRSCGRELVRCVAARSGGFHFRFDNGAWRDTRSGDELFASLARVIEAQSGFKPAWN